MFKKSLLALALAGLATSAVATEMKFNTGTSATNISVEGLADGQVTNNTITLSNVRIVLGTNYSLDDVVTFKLTGATFNDSDPFTLVETGSTGGVSFTFLNMNTAKDELKFRVTSTVTGSQVGKEYVLQASSGFDVKVASIAKDGKVSITASAKASTGDQIDTKGTADTLVLAQGVQQFSGEVAKSDATVDVASLRKSFTVSGGTIQYPTPSFTVTEPTATPTGSITETDVQVDLTGDFTGINAIKLGTASFTIAADKKSATLKTGTTFASGTAQNITFELPAEDKRVALTAPQDVKVTVSAIYGTKSLKVIDAKNLSSWSLNGDSEFVEIMPFADKYSRYVAVTNNSTVEGDIMVELFSEGKMIAAKKVGTAAKYAVTNVTAAVDAMAAENSITGTAGIRVTTNAPAANIEVTALYFDSENKDHVKVN